MIEYLIRSALVLIILLSIYHVWFENEKMQQFKRFFLLLSLFFGLIIPLISLELPISTVKTSQILPVRDSVINPLASTIPMISSRMSQTYNYWPIMIYGVVASLLFLKFTVNLLRLELKTRRNPQKRTPEGIIVLLKEKVIPHSFLVFTFLNEDDYLNNHIEDEIIVHEFAHIRQRHSLDLLFVELLKIIFWFNPIFIFYKKAIQLNHEFLADEAVVKYSHNVQAYQQLLLHKASLKTVYLASNLNYSVTKKRFIMMKKQTSKAWKMIKGLSLIPVAIILVFAFSDQIFAQDKTAGSGSQMSKEEYYTGGFVRFNNASGETLTKKYETLTVKEKKALPDPIVPTKELMGEWNDPEKYIVISGLEKINESISNLKPEDFLAYYLFKSETEKQTYVTLIKPEWLNNYKKHGGIFKITPDGLRLMLPPPIIIPAK